MYCGSSIGGSITVMWNPNHFINDFTLPYLRVKTFLSSTHSLKVLQLSPDVNCQLPILH